MPNAFTTLAGYYTAAGAGTGIAVPAPGTTFAVPSFTQGSKAYLEQVYGDGAVTDWVRIRSPRMHDPNQGIRLQVGGTQRQPLLPWDNGEVLFPSDVPTVEIDATGAGTGGILAQYGFDDYNGVQPRLDSWANVQPRIQHIMGCEVDVTSGAIGAFGNGVAINANFDNFKAGDDYALLGYTCSVACLSIVVNGPDTSGLNMGGPGDNNAYNTRDYFIQASERTGRSRIPIIAADNKAGTIVQAVDIAAATATKVSLILAQLG